MICRDCLDKGYFQAISEGECLKCGKKPPTPHSAPYKICKEWAL